jgi:dynein heavy chain
MILLGAAGSGRRTLCRLAAYMSDMQLFEANLKDEQGGFSWRESLKQIMYTAGVQGRWGLTLCNR